MQERIKLKNKDMFDIFLSEGANHKAWLVKAYALKDAALRTDWLKKENSHLSSVHIMLFGMAIEALIKASLIVLGEEVIETKGGNRYFSKKFQSHELDSLAKKIANEHLEFSSEEYELLSKLSIYVKWAARYPVPLSHNNFEPRGTSSDEQIEIINIFEKLHGFVINHG